MKRELKLPLTIEKQLESYYLNERHTERHEILWHAWNQNKRWINQLLQMTLAAFPTYSRHDESHASSVLHNIEMILGEERIAELSASDCFVLLHTVYIHDIGMCITYEDRKNIVTNRKFLEMVDELEEEGEHSLSQAIEALKKTDYSYENEEERIVKTQKLYEDKLQVYYALIHLVANYRRAEHGERSRERLYTWTLEPDKLGIGFSLSGIPLRIFLSIANSAQLHTNPQFQEILSLPQEDDGFALDYYHPRFISVLLQLGDILDMDNNRFHPLTKECMGSLPEISEQHYDKHLAIRRLHIRPDKISIEADCKTQESLRLVRKECDMLVNMLKSAGYYWSVICPPDFIGSLPTVDEVKLSLEGRRIPEELVTTQFRISQKKAFSLLEGANVYSGRYVFLREFLQNAVDATKMQYWNECCSTKGYYGSPKAWKYTTPNELNQKVSVENFPIEIEMEIQKKDRSGKLSCVTEEDLELLDAGKSEYAYGVKVRVKDFGTGIDKDRILNISKVGNSRKTEKIVIENMPEWLQPTAEFGVGLQSAFLLTGSFKCYTYTRTGQRYEITFGAVSTARHEGYINVKPVDHFEEKEDTFGTCFEVFVPYQKKFLHQDCYEAWNGEDAFDEYYECRRPLRHSAELLAQMALYMDKQVGELLFPVRLHIKCPQFIECSLNKTEKSTIRNIQLISEEKSFREERYCCVDEEQCYDEEGVRINKNEPYLKQHDKWGKGKTSWIYHINDYLISKEERKDVACGKIDSLIYLFDYSNGELHIWDGKRNVFATMNSKNLISLKNMENDSRRNKYSVPNGTRVYYKGIELERRCIEEDSELIEYVDIKGALKREYINLNRNGFTTEGEEYFEKEIYGPIFLSAKKILRYLSQKYREDKCDFPTWIENNIDSKCRKVEIIDNKIKRLESEIQKNVSGECYNKKQKNIEKYKYKNKWLVKLLEEQIISVVMLAYLAMREEYNQISCDDDSSECPWQKLLQQIWTVLDRHKGVCDLLRAESVFFDIILYDESCNYQLGQVPYEKRKRGRSNLIDVFLPGQSYAIVQNREGALKTWRQYLIQVSPKYDILGEIQELQFIREKKLKDERIGEIEKWGNKILKNARNIKELYFADYSLEDSGKQQFITKWLLRSVPTVAIFTNESGNIRVNVLSNKTMPFLYVNENYKLLVMERMLQTWRDDGIKRFSFFSWYNHMYLACKEVPYKIYCVKRGYMGNFGLNKTIVPIGEHELKNVMEELTRDDSRSLAANILTLFEKVSMEEYVRSTYLKYGDEEYRKQMTAAEIKFCQTISPIRDKVSFKALGEVALEMVQDAIKSNYAQLQYEEWVTMSTLENLIHYVENAEVWQEIFLKIAQIQCNYFSRQLAGIPEEGSEYKNEMRTLAQTKEFDILCRAYLCLSFNFLNFVERESRIPIIRDEYLLALKTDSKVVDKQRRINDYVSKHGYYRVSQESIEKCYIQFAKDLFDLFQKLEMRGSVSLLMKMQERMTVHVDVLVSIGHFIKNNSTKEEK